MRFKLTAALAAQFGGGVTAAMAALWLAGCASSDVKVVSLTPEQLSTKLANTKTCEFTVLVDGSLISPSGVNVELKDLPEYLARTKFDRNAMVVLWLVDKPAAAGAQRAISAFRAYGATNFAVRMNEQINPRAKPPGDVSDKTGRTAYLVGKANPQAVAAGDPVPDFSERPETLRPGKLLARVRYKFASDREMIDGAELVRRLFIAPAGFDSGVAYDTALLVNPGAWERLRATVPLPSAKEMKAQIPLGRRTLTLEGRVVQSREDYDKVVAAIRNIVVNAGGAEVRALTSEEMAHWWTFIGFDIEEPVYVMETNTHVYRFVISLLHGRLFLVDDLNALPTR